MSYGPRIQQKAPPVAVTRQLYDKKPLFTAPAGCEPPPPGAFTLMAFETKEAKADPVHAFRSMPLDDSPCLVFGSSQSLDGQVHDGDASVSEQHAALFYQKGKWFVKAINSQTHLESMTLHPYLRDQDGMQPKRYTSQGNRKTETVLPMDSKKKLTREICVFKLGDSDRRFWLCGPLPLKDGEMEEAGQDGEKKSKRDRDGGKDKKDTDRRGRDKDRDNERGREREGRERERERSRSRRRR